MRLNKILFLVFSLICLCSTDMIVRDYNFPVMWKQASINTADRTLELRFRLPVRTKTIGTTTSVAGGLAYGQFIGVRFQSGTYKFTDEIVSSCTLSSSVKTYSMTLAKEENSKYDSTTARDNYVFCQLTDKENPTIPADTTLTLSFNFVPSSPFTPSSFIHNISIFTTTSNNPHGVIIDTTPSFGSIGLYKDYTDGANNNIIQISNGGGTNLATIITPASVDGYNTLYPGYTIHTRLVLEVKSLWQIDPDDYIFYVKFSQTSFTMPNALSTEKFSDSKNENKLSESLRLTQMTDGFLITGFNRDTLFPKRKFRLVLESMITKDLDLGITSKIHFYVYYKNTYSIVSYSSIDMDVVNKVSLKGTSVQHPENFPIYDGMGWPFQFKFRSETAFATGGFVVIRQRDYDNKTASVNLVASTCDFTGLVSENAFGNRPTCFPLRNDFNFEATTTTFTTFTEGSGIFFKMNTIAASSTNTTLYSLKVWGFVEKCYDSANASNAYYKSLAFTIRLFRYGYANNTYDNEKRFFTDDTSINYLLASADNVILSSKCYPLQTRSEDASDLIGYADEDIAKITVRSTNDLLPIGIEVNNIFLTYQETTSKLVNFRDERNFFYSHTNVPAETYDTTTYPLSYIFDGSSTDLQGKFLLFFALIRTRADNNNSSTYNFNDYIPSECKDTTATIYLTGLIEPRIQWLFSREWFIAGNDISTPGCQINWQYVDNWANAVTLLNVQNTTLFFGDGVVADDGLSNPYYVTTITSKRLTANSGAQVREANMSTSLSKIDSTTTASGADLTYKITSNSFTLTNGQENLGLSMTGFPCTGAVQNVPAVAATYSDVLQLGVYTNCLKWGTKPSAITWLYTYFEIQQLLLHSGSHPVRIIRFIKLYPELGVFHNPEETDDDGDATFTDDTKEKWIISHHQATTASSAPFAVCLIEISSKIIDNYRLTASNTLFVWLFGASLLDIDVNNMTSEYPVAPLPSATAYGFNSGQTMSMAFRRVGDPQDLAVDGTLGVYPNVTTGQLSELEIYFYKTVLHASYRSLGADATESTNQTLGFSKKRTLYHMYLGSLIIIKATGNPTGEDKTINLFIPYLCPSLTTGGSTTYPANGIYWVTPIATLAWGQMSAYNSISSIDAYVSPAVNGKQFDTYASSISEISIIGTKSPIMTPLYLSPSQSDTETINSSNPRTDTNISTRSISLQTLKVYFQPYTDVTTANAKKLSMKNISGADKYASSFSIFLNTAIGTLDTAPTINLELSAGVDTSLKSKTIANTVYILGKPFNRFLAWAYNPLLDGAINGNNSLTTTPAWTNGIVTLTTALDMYVSGIPRLDIANLNSTDAYIDSYNFIAIFTQVHTMKDNTDATTQAKHGINTNLKIKETTFKDFILWHPDEITTTWDAVISQDISETTIKDDRASNLKIVGTFPSLVPSGSKLEITITGSVLVGSSVCGIVEEGKTLATECTETTTAKIICTLSKPSTKFSICCYNVYNNNTAYEAEQGQLIFPLNTTFLDNNTLDTALYPTNIYTYPTSTDITAGSVLAETTFGSSVPVDLAASTTSYFASVSNFSYTYSSTSGGFGAARIEVTLPRKATRGMILTIEANLVAMQIPNVNTRIIASFGTRQLFGSSSDDDIFIDSIGTNFTSNIILKLKNIIYKCNYGLGNIINIALWPVRTINYPKISIGVGMVAADTSNIIANKVAKDYTTTPTLPYTISAISTSLCSFTNITPRIPEEYAEYELTVDFTTVSTDLETAKPNEIMLFLPYEYYGEYQNVICYSTTSLLQCNYIERSILSIRFSTAISVTSATALTIRLVGLKNPHLISDNAIYFACSVNETDFANELRKTVIQGTFRNSAGIFPATTTVFGNITFRNEFCYHVITIPSDIESTIATQVLDGPLNPRDDPPLMNALYKTMHRFGFTLDTANLMIAGSDNNITIVNSPELYITFPPEYKFHWYTFTPSALIETFRLNAVDEKTIEKFDLSGTIITGTTSTTAVLAVSKVTVVGNQLRITFNLSTIVLDKYFQYFIISLYDVPPPADNTENTTDNGKVTTERFNFLIFNFDMTRVFRTWTNLNNFANLDIPTTYKINEQLTMNKGLRYVFDQKKWVIDSYDKVNNKLNSLIIRTGRYLTYSWRVRTVNNSLLSPVLINISIDDADITFGQTSYDVATYLFSDISFTIGVKCGFIPGFKTTRVKINSSSETDNIYNKVMPFSPITIEIRADVVGIVNFTKDNSVTEAGSLFVDFSVIESPFDKINIEFAATDDSSIQNTSIPATKTSTRTVFRMINKESKATQSYTLGATGNDCFEFAHEKITFVIDKIVANIPNDVLTKDKFAYFNNELDPTVPTNSVKFLFTTEYTQIYVYAVLTCINDDFPSDSAIKTQNVTESLRQSYFSEILNIKGSATIQFDNLIRNTPYKLKVFIESTQGDLTLRTSSNITITDYAFTNGTVVPIIASKPHATYCASYRFRSRPGIQVTNPLLWYWQRHFSSAGYYESGCISAVDQYGTVIPGLPNITAESNCGKSNCRFVQRENYVINQTATNVPETYTICAYPLSTCAVDPADYDASFNSIVALLNTNATLNTTLNIRVVPEFNLTVLSADSTPVKPTTSTPTRKGQQVEFTGKSESPLRCFVKAINGAQPSEAEFNTCGTDCSSISVATVDSTFSVNLKISGQGTYNLYSNCYNDMHCSTSSTGVFSLGSVSLSQSDIDIIKGNNSTNNNSNTNSTANSSFVLTYSMILICFIISALLN